MSHTTWVADRTTLLRLYLLVCSKLDYGGHVYCTASPCTLCILDPVQNEGLHLVTGLHIESNILPLDLHKESLAIKALLCPYFLPFSLLWSLLVSHDLASSSWKFALLVHPQLLDAVIVDFNVLEL